MQPVIKYEWETFSTFPRALDLSKGRNGNYMKLPGERERKGKEKTRKIQAMKLT